MDDELFNLLAEIMPDAPIDCAGCTRQVAISKAVQREGKFFHSERCADREAAPMIKPQNKSQQYEGWDI